MSFVEEFLSLVGTELDRSADELSHTPDTVRDSSKVLVISYSGGPYPFHFLTMISLLLGFPTRNFLWDNEDLVKVINDPKNAGKLRKITSNISFTSHLANLARNIFKWHQPSSPFWQKALSFSLIFPLLAFSWHMLLAIPNLLLNVARLLTIPLPFFLLMSMISIARFLFERSSEDNKDSKFEQFANKLPNTRWVQWPLLAVKGLVMFLFLCVLFSATIVAFTARAIFSPVENFKNFWSAHTGPFRVIGKPLAILSALITISAYIALAVFALPALVTLAPAYLPAFAVTGLNAVLAAFTWLAGLGSIVFTPIGAVISSVVGSVFAGTAITNAVIGLAAVTGAVLGIVGSLWAHFARKLDDWCYYLAVKEFVTIKPDATIVAADAQPEKEQTVKLDDSTALHTKGAMQALSLVPAADSSVSQPLLQLQPEPVDPQQKNRASNPLHAPPPNLSAIQSAPASKPGSLPADRKGSAPKPS